MLNSVGLLLCLRYLYFFEKAIPQVTSAIIQGLIDLINTQTQSEPSTQNPEVSAYLANSLRYIQFQRHKGGISSDRYSGIHVP